MRTPLHQRIAPGILEALAQRKTTIKAVARLYGVSEGYLSRTLKQLNLTRIPAPTVAHKKHSKALKAIRTQFRLDLAKKALQGTPVPQVAREANCSVRTMYRYLELVK